jgi:GT2 family glycosyltransferase
MLIVGCAVYNNIKYTKLFLESIKCSYPYEIFIVDNGSTDETHKWLTENNYNHRRYDFNMGFGYAYNDAMDYAFKKEDNLLLWCGNDIVFRPESINHMVKTMLETDYDMLCGNEILNKEVLDTNADVLREFKYKFSFDEPKYDKLEYTKGGMNHSCLIRKKSVFDKVGYYDVNLYPAYFEDNDYARRCDLLNIKYGTVLSAIFYHFWSRTIYEGGAGDLNRRTFERNRRYYIRKWGGQVGSETFTIPFDTDNNIKISTRDAELSIIRKVSEVF